MKLVVFHIPESNNNLEMVLGMGNAITSLASFRDMVGSDHRGLLAPFQVPTKMISADINPVYELFPHQVT